MSIAQITSHVADGLANLLSQFSGKPRLTALVTAALTEVQRLEDVGWDVYEGRLIENAIGHQLDVIGEIVGFPRSGLDDDEYRRLIQVGIQINRHDAQADDALFIWSQLVDVTNPVRYVQLGIAHFGLWWESTPLGDDDWLHYIAGLMPRIAASGVSWELIESQEDGFIFDDATRGFDLGKMGRRVDVL